MANEIVLIVSKSMITQNRVVVTVCFLVILLGELAAAANNPLLRQTKFGSVEGYDDNERGVWGWRGIPFAKPPVGNLRWRKPEDPEPWKGIRPAKKYSPACIQPSIEPPLTILPQATGSEDCLYLNVYRPQTAEENLPVYFWIHGGGNIFGSAEGCSEGCCVEDLARNANMVVVVVQYRLGVLGFFTHPALRSGASGADDSGNFGMLDQIKALQWVRNNITAFGGNPYNVTIAGHSAGGYAVGELTISPLARGLFHRAVNQSGGWLSQSIASIDETANCTIENALIMKDLAKDLKDARRIRREMTDFELASFLRDMPASELVSAHFRGGSPAKPVWAFAIEDGLVIPGPVFQVVESGRYSRVPTIMGVTRTESGFDNITVPSLYPGMPDYRDLIQVVEGKRKLEEVLPTPRDQELWLKARHYGSMFYRALVDEHARRLAVQQYNVYVYSFDWGSEKVCSKTLAFTYGSAHCMELPFFFGNVNREELWAAFSPMFSGFTEDNRPGRLALSDAMVSYLAKFVRTGNPNNASSGLLEWQAWSNHVGGPKTLTLDADLNKAQIAMNSQEISIAAVRRRLDAEPAAMRKHVLAVVSVYQPFHAYEVGDYEFSLGR